MSGSQTRRPPPRAMPINPRRPTCSREGCRCTNLAELAATHPSLARELERRALSSTRPRSPPLRGPAAARQSSSGSRNLGRVRCRHRGASPAAARAGLTTCLPPQLSAEPGQKSSPWVRLGLQLAGCSWRGGAGKPVLTRKAAATRAEEVHRQACMPPTRNMAPESSVPTRRPAALAM